MSSKVTDQSPAAVDALVDVLSDALRALATAGNAEDANRLAARAYVALRHTHPDQAQRINVLMHRLARALTPNRGSTPATTPTPMPTPTKE